MSVKFVSLIFLIICIASRSWASSPWLEMIETLILGNSSYRLPNNTAPRLYMIHLEPHIDDIDFTFNGTSSTLFEVLHPTDSVVVHASKLIEIDKSYTEIIHSNGTILEPESQEWNRMLEFFEIKFNYTLDIGNYTIKFKWRGHDAPNLLGFYRAFYNTTDENENEITEFLVTTEFQPSAARSAFPCWDEPGLKAEFEISLKHYPHYKALSNMPVKDVVDADDKKVWTSFERSPLMPTYLVVVLVTPYPHYVNNYGNITMWAPDREMENVKFAFERSLEIVPVMEEYTGIPYSLPKMDQAMIPQYPAGATEHWGLISYGPGIGYSVKDDNGQGKDFTVILAAHEIAHQWFGNLVTPVWWDDVWLSEAFATYFQYKIVDKIMNTSDATNLFDTEMRNQVAFRADEYGRRGYPIKWMPKTPGQVFKMFGAVTYRKGACVIGMLEHILTEEVFQDGIKKYLNTNKYNSVVTDDLWKALQDAYSEKGLSPDLNVKEVMDPWLEQTGYPLVNVTRDYETGVVTITQKNVRKSEPDNLWMIPINYATSSDPNFTSTRPTHWVPRSNESLVISGIDKEDWIILNVQNKGFYRVNYDLENWKRIANYLNSDNYKKIDIINRSQLLYDIMYLAIGERLYLPVMMDMVSYLHREKNYLPWTTVTRILEPSLFSHYLNNPSHESISKWALHLMDSIINYVGCDDNGRQDHMSALARKQLSLSACVLGHKGCQAAATAKLINLLTEGSTSTIPSHARREIYYAGLIGANETVWDMVIETTSEDDWGYDFLGCINNQTLMKKYLDLAFDTNNTRTVYYALHSVFKSSWENINSGIDYFIVNYDRLDEYFRENNATEEGPSMEKIIEKVVRSISTEDQLEKLTKLIRKKIEEGKIIEEEDETINAAKKNLAANKEATALINSLINKKSLSSDSANPSDNQDVETLMSLL